MNLDKYPDVLTLRECQKILQVSRGTMLRLLHEGEIPAFRIGNRWRIQRKEMLEFIERSEYWKQQK
ncbi:helix-turn-helix domain-containing protein [Agathobaculum sp.]|mgnify:FL=1|uniref:helix-turn-helix domain-containing protein n=2 Tax=Butyricicoccaceae TaxID=3085642 RepID=UPI00352025B4